jgi:ABC-2 type transport system permease protein
MSALLQMIWMETKLFLREPATLAFSVLLPIGLMLVFGLGFRGEPAPVGNGQHDAPTFLPALSLMISVGMLGFFALPSVLGSYREKGILRRLSTTPVPPAALLVAQLVVQLAVALVAVVALVLVGHLVVGLPLPQNVPGFVAAVVLGLAGLFAVGLVVAALSPNARVAGSVGPLLFFPMLFLAGVWLPRDRMPDTLATIGAYSPLGALIDTVGAAWAGAAPAAGQVVAMAALAVVLGAVAARTFRWE